MNPIVAVTVFGSLMTVAAYETWIGITKIRTRHEKAPAADPLRGLLPRMR